VKLLANFSISLNIIINYLRNFLPNLKSILRPLQYRSYFHKPFVLIIFLIGSESATFIIIVDTKMNKEHTEIINNEISCNTIVNASGAWADEVAKIFRDKMGFRLRVATKYHNLARKYLKKFGITDYLLIDSQGATEGLIKNEVAEVVIDITSTGQTFKSNNLKILPIDPIKKSEVALFASLKRKPKIILNQNKSFFKKLSINL